MVLGVGAAYAQYDPEALKVLDKVSKKYEAMGSFSADFTNQLVNDAANTNIEMEGKFSRSGRKFRLEWNGQEYMSDGSTLWVYQPDAQEVYISSLEDEMNDDFNPSEIHNLYRKGFKYLLKGEQSINGKAHHLIDLVPEKAQETNFFKIQMAVNKADMTISNFTLYEKNGTRYVFNIKNLNAGANIPDSQFSFDKKKYPGVTVVDTRL
jgi:outer membrane lipoprotein-sorting protein